MTHKETDFIGAWALEEWKIVYPDGKATYPFGEEAIGQIMYAQNGQMSATVRRNKRAGISGKGPKDWSEADKAAAFDEYFHYAGSWRIDGEAVRHSVTMSLNPSMTGTDQVRHAEFRADSRLVLSADEPIGPNKKRHHALTWRRHSS